MKTKSLIVAICLLVVSATLLGTASFAWFSMNTEVNVDGIEVEAYSDALFLEISKDNSTFLTSTTLAEGNKTLRLVTPVSVDLTALKSIVATPATGYATSGTYYVKDAAISAGDTYASDNYIKVTTFEAATALETLYRFEFGNLLTAGDVAITGATYVKWNNTTNDYSVVTVNAGASVAGCRRVYSYVKSTDNTVVDGTTYYELNASSRAFTEVSGLVADAPIDQETVYYKKVDGVFALGEGTYTVADDTNNVVYYQRNSGGNYEVASYVTPGTLLDGTYYTIAESVATATVAADSKVWMVDTNGNYICVYHNTSATESVTLNSEKLFWGKSYSDTLGNVGNGPIAVLKDGAVANYVYEDEIYLRSALNTNDGKNLRIDGITVTGKENYLSDAIRIYFVATNQRGGKHVYIYDNGASFTPETLFSDILGNQLEVVTVKMYMYFDGTDEVALTATSAAGELNSQRISVEFAINGVDYTVNP